MTLSELRTFLAIVETGSLVRASRVLNVTQSTVTARLKSLEAELGQTLIRRQKSGATLTPAGERLRRYAATISDLWQQARQETALPDGLSSVCNIAMAPELWPGLGNRLLNWLRRTQPRLGLSLWTGSGEDIAAWLASGRADLALSYRPAADARLDQIELPPERLILVSTRADAPMRHDPGYVFVDAGEAFGRAHAAAYADADTARLSFGSAIEGRDHILAHGGSAYLPLRLVVEDLGAGRLHEIAGAPAFTRRVFVLVNRESRAAWAWFDACAALLAAQTSADDTTAAEGAAT